MRLLILLFSFCVLALSSTVEIKGPERSFGKMSAKNKAKLKKEFGPDAEKIKFRLERLGQRKLNSKVTDELRNNMQQKMAKIPTVHIDKTTNENFTVDLVKLNMREGVSDYLFQGDIHLTEAQLEELETESTELPDSPTRKKRQAWTYAKKWTGNTVKILPDARKKASTAAAIQFIQSRTCINFVQSSTAANRIKVFDGIGCYSFLGMVGVREQTLSLQDGCESMGTVAHELIHALGFEHTQSRSDRDSYIRVDLSDVPTNRHGNFYKIKQEHIILYGPYEYGSTMHYPADAFVKDGSDALAIVPHDGRYAYTMGSEWVSFYDIQMINDHYGCSAKCPPATSPTCKNGGVPNPRNCAICNCPLGYGGALCDQRPIDPGCGATWTVTANWQTKEFSFGNLTNTNGARDTFIMCTHWLTAPSGKKVQIKITKMSYTQCQYGCPFNGIEIKTDANTRVTNPRICCQEFINQVFTSNLNPTPIIGFNRFYQTTFTIGYRYVDGPVVTTAKTTTRTTTRIPTTTKSITTTTKPKFLTCGGTLAATVTWQEKYIVHGTNSNYETRNVATTCTHWITAPTGKLIQVRITYMSNTQCHVKDCATNAIQIKTSPDITVGSVQNRFCCYDVYNKTFTSSINPTQIIAYNRWFYSTFTFDYRWIDDPSVTTAKSTTKTTTRIPTTTQPKFLTCGGSLPAASTWRAEIITTGTNTSYVIRNVSTTCSHWITAPTGKKIQILITYAENTQCGVKDCAQNAIEIRTNPTSNNRMCCFWFSNGIWAADRNPGIFTSSMNPTQVTVFNRWYYSTFTIQYRYVDGTSTVIQSADSTKTV